jgi:hypothetical protein
MRFLDRSLFGTATVLLAVIVWVLGPVEIPPRLEPTALARGTDVEDSSLPATWIGSAHRSENEAPRSAPATIDASASGEPAPAAEGVADLAVLVLGPDGPRAEQRLELWRIESASGSSESAPEENLIALGVDSTDARGWLLWPALPYGRYLVCLPPAPGQRGYRGPGVTGRRLLELEHRAELLAERVLELQP